MQLKENKKETLWELLVIAKKIKKETKIYFKWDLEN